MTPCLPGQDSRDPELDVDGRDSAEVGLQLRRWTTDPIEVTAQTEPSDLLPAAD